MLISQSCDAIVSLFRDSFSKSVRLGRYKSAENDSMEMSHHGFISKFSELKYEPKRVHFSSYECFFILTIYTWCMKEKKM